MGKSRNPSCYLNLIFTFLTILKLISPSESSSDYTSLVYKGCSQQNLSDPNGAFSQALSSLFGTLVAQSSKSKFFKTTTGSNPNTITGLFQCRGDLSNIDCYNCISNLPVLTDKLCGKPIAARVQLLGCYMLYESAGYNEVSGMEMLYKICSLKDIGGAGFEEKRDTALNEVENGMSGGIGGFFGTSYGGLNAMGQCEGDLSSSDCVSCVQSAVQRAQVECGSSASGQVYLNKCFVTYGNSASGGPGKSSPSSSSSSPSVYNSGGNSPYSLGSYSGQHNTGRTVAIIVGGLAGVGFLVICLLFARSKVKQQKDYS